MKMKQFHIAVVLPQGGGNFVYRAFTADEAVEKARAEFPQAKEISVTFPKNNL